MTKRLHQLTSAERSEWLRKVLRDEEVRNLKWLALGLVVWVVIPLVFFA